METVLDTVKPTASKGQFTQKPKWLRVKLPTGKKYTELRLKHEKCELRLSFQNGLKIDFLTLFIEFFS